MARRRRRRRRQQTSKGAPIKQLTFSQAWDRFQGVTESSSGQIEVGIVEAYKRSAWVYGAISLIADVVSQQPFVILDGTNLVENGPLVDLVRKPNEYGNQNTSEKYRYAYLTELLLHGAVMRLFPEMNGFVPEEMLTEPRWRFRAQTSLDKNGKQIVNRWQFTNHGATIDYTPDDNIYHDVLYNPFDEIEGLSPLRAVLIAVTNDISAGEFASRFFANDASSGVVFTSDHPSFNQAAANEAAEAWKRLYGGKLNAFAPKFVGFGLEPKLLGSALDARTLQVLKSLTKAEIVTGIYKIPLEMFGSQERSGSGISIGGASPEPAKETFITNVAMPWASRYDSEFNRDVSWRFGGTLRGKHDFTQHPVLEKRRLERAKAAGELIDRGVPLNEVIRWLRLEIAEQPHGEEWWVDNDLVPSSFIMKVGTSVLDKRSGTIARNEHTDEYVGSIISLAKTAKLLNKIRVDERRKTDSNGESVRQRILEILRHDSS